MLRLPKTKSFLEAQTLAKVLVADDDPSVRDLLKALLETKGHESVTASDGQTALQLIRREEPDLAILDIGMPHLDGMRLTETVRESGPAPDLPIILLTSRQEPASRYAGFLKGADDYVSKPFDPVELLLRVDALLRRTRKDSPDPQVLVAGPYQLDPGRFVFRASGDETLLTRSEFAIMAVLFRKTGQVVSVDDLLAQALDYPRGVGSPDTVHTHVRNLRHKIEPDPTRPRIVRTVARLGYRFAPDPAAP